MGNICRSPTAEGVFRQHVLFNQLEKVIQIDSAGTHAYHVGEAPDPRAQAAAMSRGIDLSRQKARRVEARDFERFDYILAMDKDNLQILQSLCPPGYEQKLSLLLDYSDTTAEQEVPDPYYGGSRGFDRVLDLVEEASEALLTHIRQQHLDQ